jgi:hypothetical protein
MTDTTDTTKADDWRHLKAYGYAPGHYMNRCHLCNATVAGVDKRAITCRACAEKLHAARLKDTDDE